MDANNSVTKEILKKSNIAALTIAFIGLIAAAIAGWYATGAFEIAQEDLEAIKKNVAQSRQLAEESLKHQQIIDAWHILTTRTPGNSGKKDAIETLLAAGQKLTGIDLSSETHGGSVYLQNLQAANADLSFAELQYAMFGRANLQGARLFEACLQYANLEWANLKSADLWESNLEGAYLWGSNLKSANLEWADLKSADLWESNLEGADLEKANLENANLESTKFFGADISGADFEGAENLDLVKWSEDDGIAPAFALKTDPPKNLPPEILEKIELLGDEEYQARKKEWLQLDYE